MARLLPVLCVLVLGASTATAQWMFMKSDGDSLVHSNVESPEDVALLVDGPPDFLLRLGEQRDDLRVRHVGEVVAAVHHHLHRSPRRVPVFAERFGYLGSLVFVEHQLAVKFGGCGQDNDVFLCTLQHFTKVLFVCITW